MNPLRTTVVMKTDISGSTARFRQLLAADLQALLSEHRDFLARHAAEHDGRIMKGAGDGYWLEFTSVTGAAKAAIAMQESLRLAQLSRGDDRLAIRIVIALGDIAFQDGDFIGDAFALAARVEAVTPPTKSTSQLVLGLPSHRPKSRRCSSRISRSRALPNQCQFTVSSSAIARVQSPTPTSCSQTSRVSVGCWTPSPPAPR
jgi:class 3 adenylate cyclase